MKLAAWIVFTLLTASPAAVDSPSIDSIDGSSVALDVDPLAATPEMQAFIAERIPEDYQRETRLQLLQEAIFDPKKGLGITYGAHETYTAGETFRRATGNCLSFTLLFVSMARHMGFTAHFVEVDEVTGWSHRGDVNFSHWHMYAEVELKNGIIQIDFLPWQERRYRVRKRIDEERVRAHFFNNLGAQELSRGGSAELSISYFENALRLDETFTPAQINLAAALRRTGRIDEAEKLLLRVLDEEQGNPQAASNLANLYASQGMDDRARKWMKKRNRYLQRNPFHHFRLGLAAMNAGDAAAARDHFRGAMIRDRHESVFYEHLGYAYLALNETEKARSSLRQAIRKAESKAEEERIEALMSAKGL